MINMTNDELLVKIEELIAGTSNYAWEIMVRAGVHLDIVKNWQDEFAPLAKALRAVVELHKPNNGGTCEQGCTYDDIELGERENPYPCPTIQAIEEQLI